MFEDFKEKVGKLQNKKESEISLMSTALAPEITEKLRKAGIAPDNVIIQQLFPRTLDEDANDLSLMSGAEFRYPYPHLPRQAGTPVDARIEPRHESWRRNPSAAPET